MPPVCGMGPGTGVGDMGLRKGCCCISERGGVWPWGPGEQIRSPTWALKGSLVWKALMKVFPLTPHPLAHLFHYLGTNCGGDLGEAWSSTWCRGAGASASSASRGLMAWRDAHLGTGTRQPHLWAGWGCFLFSCPGRQGEALLSAVSCTI